MSKSVNEHVFGPEDDLFHPTESKERDLVETVWWNFYIPQANIDAEIYLNFRRNLGLTYAGIYIWDDFCRHFVDLRYFDTRSYLPLPTSDLDDFKLDNGLRMRVEEPLQRYTVEYDGIHNCGFRLEFDALARPLGFVTAPEDSERARYAPGHFDQVGRMRGELRLDGETLSVDCITQRDRSWGAVRKEDPGYPPDVGWHSAHFGTDLWFQCWIWHKEPIATDLQGGVVYKKGRPVRIVRAARSTEHDASGIEARVIDLRLADAEGEEYRLIGTVRNMFPWPGWFNMVGFAGLVEWQLDGRQGWGEVHDGRTVAGTIARKRQLRRAG